MADGPRLASAAPVVAEAAAYRKLSCTSIRSPT